MKNVFVCVWALLHWQLSWAGLKVGVTEVFSRVKVGVNRDYFVFFSLVQIFGAFIVHHIHACVGRRTIVPLVQYNRWTVLRWYWRLNNRSPVSHVPRSFYLAFKVKSMVFPKEEWHDVHKFIFSHCFTGNACGLLICC